MPDVVLKNPDLQFQHCFLGHPYEQSFELINDTDLPACYGLLPQVIPPNQVQFIVFSIAALSNVLDQTLEMYFDVQAHDTRFCLQPYEEDPALLYSSPHARGVIQPYSTEQIPIVFQAKTVGNLQETAHIAILGRQDPPLVSICLRMTLRQVHILH